MKIAVVPSFYPNKYNPEQAIFIKEQVDRLVSMGHSVYVLSPILKYTHKISNIIKNRYDRDFQNGVVVYYKEVNLFVPAKIRWITNLAFYKALLFLYKNFIVEYGQPDVFYAHFSFPAGYAASKLAEKYEIPLVTEEHFSQLMFPVDKGLQNIVSRVILKSQKFICVSSGLKKSLKKQLGDVADKCEVVSNMINECFSYTPPRVKRNEFVFFSLGNLIRRKGFDLLIDAFSEEFINDENVKLVIAGDGHEYFSLKERVGRYHQEGKILLVGHIDRADSLKYYQSCDCFVLSSRSETFGLVYREAMAVGIPIISTNHGGFS